MKRTKLLPLFIAFALAVFSFMPCAHAQTFLYEGFESGSMPSGWTQEGSGAWSVGTGDQYSYPGAYAGTYNAKRIHSTDGTATKLITPAIDCSSKAAVILTFAYINRDWNPCDILRIYYRTSSEGSWTQVEEISSAHASWTQAEYTLPTSNSATFQVAFEMYDRYGYGIGLDEVTIAPAPDCLPLKTLSATTTRTSATANWAFSTASIPTNCLGYEVKLTSTNDPDTTAIQSATINDPTVTSYAFNNLDRETTYYVHVRSNCGNDDGYSTWVSASATTRGLSGCYDDIVADGTATSAYVPFEGYNYDGSFSRSQFIYSSDKLTSLRGKTLNKLVFFSSLSSNSFGGTIEVRIGVTTANDLSSGYEAEPSTVVYSGALTVANNQWTIDFGANTFNYPEEGGNLLIQVKKVSAGSWGHCPFYGTDNNVSGISRYNSGTNTTFLPKAQFSYCETALPCPAVTNLSADSITTTSTVINWTASTGDYVGSYDVLLSDSVVTDFASKTPQYTGLTATSKKLDSLDEYTDYYVYVRVNCNGYGHDDGDAWSEGVHFQTLSPCNVPTNLSVELLSKRSAMLRWTSTAQTSNYRYYLTTDSTDVPIDATTATVSGIYADSVLIENLTPGTTYYLYLSNMCGKRYGCSPWIPVTFTTPDACLAPDTVFASDIQMYQLTLNWVPNPYADPTDAYDVLISDVQVTDFASVTPTATGVTGTSYTFDTLFRNTIYYMYVRANCGEAGATNWLETTALTDSIHPDCPDIMPRADASYSTNSSLPIYGYGMSNSSCRTQFIYPYTELQNMNEGRIGSMTFYSNTSSFTFTANTQVYVGITSQNNLQSGWATTPATKVFEGNLVISGSEMTITFDEPFAYPLDNQNCNLLIEFKNTTGGNSSSINFYNRYVSNAGRYQNGVSNYLPKVTFNTCFEVPACPVIDLVTIPAEKVLDDQALITWTRGTGDFTSSYNIIVAPYIVTKPDSLFVVEPMPAGVVRDSNLVDTFYLATGLTPDTRHYVYVRANCKLDPYDDGSSNWKLVEPAFNTEKACVKPFDFKVTGATSTTMSLQWLNRKQKSNWELGINDSIVNVALSDDTCRYTVTNLTPNTEYTYTLRSICGVGDTSEMVTLPGGYYQRTLNNETNINVLAIPNLELIPNTIVQDTLNHTITATTRKGSDLTNVYFDYDRSDFVSKVTSSSGDVQGNYGYINLTTPNTLTVVAEDTLIRQDWTMTLNPESCATPYNVAAANVSRRTADLTWNIGDSVATSFDLVLSTTVLEDPSTGTIQTIEASNVDGACTYTIKNLARETSYYAYVRTNCGTEFGQWRGTNFTTLAATADPCPEVADLTVTNIQPTTATITWTATGDYPGTSDVYVVTGDTTGLQHTTAGTSYTATGLTPYTDYTVIVRTHCTQDTIDDGVSPWVITTFQTESECEYPRNVEATVTGKTTAHISWTDAAGQVPTDTYEYAYSTTEAEPTSGTTSTTGSADITSLQSYTTYYIYVRKVGGAGVYSPWIQANTILTPAAMPAPTIEEVYDLSFNAFRVRWTRDYANFANETQWQYAYAASGESPSAWTTTTDTTALISGLTESTTYDFYVRAGNDNDHSLPYTEIANTTARPDDCLTIGNGTNNDYAPICAWYGYERNIYLFTPADGLTAGTIQSLAWNMTTAGQTVPAKIYLKNTTETDLSTVYTASFNTAKTDATLVYDASFTTVEGWNIIDITDFNFTGGNLMILVESNYGGGGSSKIYAYCTQSGSNNHVYARHDNSMEDNTTLNNGDYFCNPGLDNKRSNIRFCFAPVSCPKPTRLVVDNITTTSARASWYPGNAETEWSYYVATEQMTDSALNTMPATTTTTLVNALSDLTRDTDYHLYVRANCGAGDSSRWVHVAFTTLPTCSAPINPVATNSADNEITFNAAAGTYGFEGTYDFRYWKDGTTDTVRVNGQNATYVASNIIGGDYHWQVRANCSGSSEGSSRWSTGNDVRVGGEYAIPYIQGFEDVPTTYSGPGMIEHICWNDLNAAENPSYTPCYKGYTYDYTEGNRSLQLSQGNVDTLYLILPSFGDAENLSVKFDASMQSTSAPNRIRVGYFTDINDESTFVPVYTAANTYDWTSNAAYIRNLPSGARLAFSYDDSNSGLTYAYLDNVRVNTISNWSLATSVAPDANLGSVEMTCQASDTIADGRFYEGTTPVLTATPNAGFKFTRWSNGKTDNPLTVKMESDTNLVAYFDTLSYRLDVVVSNDAGQYLMADVTGSGIYKRASMVTIEATDIDEHYHVLWSDGSTENPHTFPMPAQDMVIIAHFDIDTFHVFTALNEDTMGVVLGAGNYIYGQEATIIARPAAHHHFMQWSDGVTDTVRTYSGMADSTFTAYFAIDTFHVFTALNEDTMGVVAGAGDYIYGQTATLEATANEGFHFVRWNDDNTDNPRTIQLTSDTTLTAIFSPNCGHGFTVMDVDNNVYNTVKIGEQCWLRENLRTTRYADGNAIVGDTIYYSDIYPDTNVNVAKYGRLYSWNAVQGLICPTGWHLPSDADFNALLAYEAPQLKASETWIDNSGNNYTGFNALAAGHYTGTRFENLGGESYIYSSTPVEGGIKFKVCTLALGCIEGWLKPVPKDCKVSVRCVMD